MVASSAGGTTRGLSRACGMAVPPIRIPRTTSQSAAVIRAQTGYRAVAAAAELPRSPHVRWPPVSDCGLRGKAGLSEHGSGASAELGVDEGELGAERLGRHG